MKRRDGLLLCLFLMASAIIGPPALADAAVEDWWTYSYPVDRYVYVNPADNLGLFMRYGPGTEYSKVNSRTIPMYEKIHVTQECTAENGWKWGYCDYQFPGDDGVSYGWVCLVETTSYDPAPKTAPPTQTPVPEDTPEPTKTPAPTSAPEENTPAPAPAGSETPGGETAAPAETPSVSPQTGGGIYTSVGLVLIGVVVGALAVAAALLLLRKKK